MPEGASLGNAAIAAIRTAVAALVGAVLTWVVSMGVTVPEGLEALLTTVVFALATVGYNSAVNWLATHVDPRLGYLLGVPKTPDYNAPAAPPVEPKE